MESENYMWLILLTAVSMVIILMACMASDTFIENSNNEFVFYYKGLD